MIDTKNRWAEDHIEYIRVLSDLFHVEEVLGTALTKMSVAAASPNLAAAFNRHQQVTRDQARRLEAILREGIDVKPMDMPGNSVTPLVVEGENLINNMPKGQQKDAALLALARRVEQKEMALYADAIRTAQSIGLPMTYVNALSQTWSEEEEADKTLGLLDEEFIGPALTATRPPHAGSL
jgi:ferritin-like metal-binding protein YciE